MDPAKQMSILSGGLPPGKSFDDSLAEHNLRPLRATGIETLQINVGRLCNQQCEHCHVEAGPGRREVMNRPTMQRCVDALAANRVPEVDITGGAPEMNPDFRWLILQLRAMGIHVIARTNLTALLRSGYDDLSEFLANHKVELIASLPCYREESVDRQRGEGVFEQALAALRHLNCLGYGQIGSGLQLSLVYNPHGPVLPPPQGQLQGVYRRQLRSRYGIIFNRLLTLVNMPVGRFLQTLSKSGQVGPYMETLVDAFNPQAAEGVMCRTSLSVDWTGRLFDCDFNQMLEIGLDSCMPQLIEDFDPRKLAERRIATGPQCYACTAGCGFGCQGAIAADVDVARGRTLNP